MFRIIGAIIGFFVGLFRRNSQRNNTNRQLDNISRQNDQRKNVISYRSCPVEAFVPRGRNDNIVASGANNEIRNRVSCAAAWNCHQSGRGAVILHCGNYSLSELVSNAFTNTSGFYSVGSHNPIYDPFVELNRNELAQMILSASGNEYKIERSGNSYIYGLADYLQLIGRPICVETLYNCIIDRSYENILEQAEAGRLSDFIARRINSEFAQGQMELGNIEQFFSVLKQQGYSVLADESSARRAISIKKALRQNEVIMIDLGSTTNTLLLNVIAQEIRDSISNGLEFSLILDSVPLDTSESLSQLLRNFSGRCNYVYSSSDVYADTQSTANVFETLIGRASTVFVLQHYSSASSRRFSEFFGQYQKIEVNQTFTSGDNYMTFGQILPGSSSGNVYATQHITKPRVEEDEIMSQNHDHMFIKVGGNSEIISVSCTEGNARGNYSTPQRAIIQPTESRRHNRINWFIFALLFIFCFPAAFIYSFFKSGRVGKIISAVLFVLSCVYLIALLIATQTYGY